MKNHSTLVFERNGKRMEREPAEVFRHLQAGDETPQTMGRLVRVDAPRQVIDLIQHLPGEAVVGDSGTVTSANMGVIILVAAICISFAAGFKAGYEAGQNAGSAASDEEGGGEDTDADSEQDDGGGTSERVDGGRRQASRS